MLLNGFEDFEKRKLDDDKKQVFFMGTNGQAPSPANQTLEVHRLHGCVAWLHGPLKDENIYFSLQLPEVVPHFSNRLCVSYPGHEQEYGRHPHSPAYTALSQSVTDATVLIFIGFSFRDPDVISVIGKSLYDKSISQRETPVIIIIDPQLTKEEVMKRVDESLFCVAGPCADWHKMSIQIVNMPFPSEGLGSAIKEIIGTKGVVNE
jgi:hypothetical protein